MADAVDHVLAQWSEQRPNLDVSPMGVVGRISRAGALLEREIARVFEDYGLQPGEFDLLATLRRSGEPFRLAVGELLRSTMVTSGAVTHRLNRLEGKGFISRELDPTNRRSIIITLTAQGRETVDEAVVAHVENERCQLRGLKPNEQAQLARLLRKLLVSLEEEVDPIRQAQR